jgi:hypothetical protein
MFLETFKACSMIYDLDSIINSRFFSVWARGKLACGLSYPVYGSIVSRSKISSFLYVGPPQGGDKKTASDFNSEPRVLMSSKKSPTMNSIFSDTPYICALCFAHSIAVGFLSIAMTRLHDVERANCIVLPPTPQKASITVSAPDPKMCWAIFLFQGLSIFLEHLKIRKLTRQLFLE